jgi:hypothetical protein
VKSTVELQTAAADPGKSPATGDLAAPKISWAWQLLHFSPFLVVVWFVSRFGVNVPIYDDWGLAAWFHAVRFKQATFRDLFAQANEHRFVFPKLIWTPLAFATHWNLRMEMLLNLVPAAITFAVLYAIALRQARQTDARLFHLASFSMSFFLFSLVQYQTWLWAITGCFLFVQALAALAVGACCLGTSRPWLRFGLAAVCCLVASFSMAWGLACWLALAPSIALLQMRRGKFLQLFLWCCLFAATAALYSYHFQTIVHYGQEDTLLSFLYHPLRSAHFFLTTLGSAFCQGAGIFLGAVALAAGVGLLVALASCLLMLRGERRELVAPWLSVALMGLLFAGMVTAARSHWLIATVQTRYITPTILVSVAAIQLGRLACRRQALPVYLFCLGVLWTLITMGSIHSLEEAGLWKQHLSHAKLFVEVIHYMDPATIGSPESGFDPTFPQTNITPSAESLNETGFLRLASNVTFVDQASPEHGSFESADESGNVLHLRHSKDKVTVSGWASLPAGRGPPKLVLISYDEQKTFVTGAVVGWVDRTDIAARRGDPRYLHSGWQASFSAKFLPMGKGILKAWVYDAAEKKFLRIPASGGEKRFNVETE